MSAGNGQWSTLDGIAPDLFGAIRCSSAPDTRNPMDQVAPSATLPEAVQRMWWRQRGAIAVLDGDRLVGALGEDDLVRICHHALRDQSERVEAHGGNLLVWEQLLGDLRIGDVMTPFEDLAAVRSDASLLEGVRLTLVRTRQGSARRHIFVVDDSGRLERVVSIRDVCRYLIALYDGDREAPFVAELSDPVGLEAEVRRALDLPIGVIRGHRAFGHDPITASIDDPGAATVEKVWAGGRGYVLVSFYDGAPQAICTRRDLLRALQDPFVRLRDLGVARLMNAQVKAASHLITLGGVFKLMAIGGYRHMPVVDAAGQTEYVLSMWEGVALLAEGSSAAGSA